MNEVATARKREWRRKRQSEESVAKRDGKSGGELIGMKVNRIRKWRERRMAQREGKEREEA